MAWPLPVPDRAHPAPRWWITTKRHAALENPDTSASLLGRIQKDWKKLVQMKIYYFAAGSRDGAAGVGVGRPVPRCPPQ